MPLRFCDRSTAGSQKRNTARSRHGGGFSLIQRAILPNVLLKNAGLKVATEKKPKADVAAVVQGGSCMVYVLDERRHDEILERARKAFGEDIPTPLELASCIHAGLGLMGVFAARAPPQRVLSVEEDP
jgi:hypothetical protein